MHTDEKWQTYYPNGEPIIGEGWDSALGNPEKTGSDKIVGVAVVFVFRQNDNGEIDLLWQKRSDKIERFPGDYDISAGGHINLGETLVEAAIRECREEIGIDFLPEDLYFVTMRPFHKCRFAWIYAVDWTHRGDDFRFDDNEVSEVKWVPLKETDAFRKEFGKKPLKNDEITFRSLENWFKLYGRI